MQHLTIKYNRDLLQWELSIGDDVIGHYTTLSGAKTALDLIDRYAHRQYAEGRNDRHHRGVK